MNEQEAQAEIDRLAKVGISAIMVIVVFGRTDDAHRYAVKCIY
jgi:hypothetical protein